MTEEQVRRQSAVGFKVGGRCFPLSLGEAARFSPRLELTKVSVEPLTLKRFQRSLVCASASDAEKTAVEPLEQSPVCASVAGAEKGTVESLEQSPPRHSPMIVSYRLSEKLQRAIANAMKRRRKGLQATSRRNKGQHSKSLARRRRKLPNRVLATEQPVRESKPAKETTSTGEIECSDEGVSDALMDVVPGRNADGASASNMEIQPDTVCVLQPGTKTRGVNFSVGASECLSNSQEDPDESCNELNQVKESGPSSNQEDSSASVCESATPQSEKQLSLEHSSSIPILLCGAQIEVETELDVLTTHTSLPLTSLPPAPDKPKNTVLDINSDMFILGKYDIDTIVDQITLSTSVSQDSSTELLDNSSSTMEMENNCLATQRTSAPADNAKQPRNNNLVKKPSTSSRQLGGKKRPEKESSCIKGVPKPRKNERKGTKKRGVSPSQPILDTSDQTRDSSEGGNERMPIGTTPCDETPVATLERAPAVTRPRGRPRKTAPMEGEPPVKRKRGRPRKTVPIEGAPPVKRPRGRPRKKKLTASTKQPSLSNESKLSLNINELEHSISEDSGYPSSGAHSRSPTDCVLTSPIILNDNVNFLHEEAFQEISSPILHDSNLGASKAETDSGFDIPAAQILEVGQNESDFNLLQGIQQDFSMCGNIGNQTATDNIFQDIDMLLNQDINPDHLFGLDENSDTQLGSANEIDDILRSPTVSSCLKGLELAGALPSDHSCQTGETGKSTPCLELNQPATSSEMQGGDFTETSHLTSDSNVNEGGDLSQGGSRYKRKVVVKSSSQHTNKASCPLLDAPMQSKSGRKLKRTWKLCLDQDFSNGGGLPAKSPAAVNSATTEESPAGSTQATSHDHLIVNSLPVSSADQGSSETAPVTVTLSPPKKRKRVVVRKSRTAVPAASDLLPPSKPQAVGDQPCPESRSEAAGDDHLNSASISGGCAGVITSSSSEGVHCDGGEKSLMSRTDDLSKSKLTTRTFRRRLSRQSHQQHSNDVKASCDGSPVTNPLAANPLAMNLSDTKLSTASTPATTASAPAKEPVNAGSIGHMSTSMDRTIEDACYKRDVSITTGGTDRFKGFSFNPPSTSVKNQPLKKSGTIFSLGGRMGSIFASTYAPSSAHTAAPDGQLTPNLASGSQGPGGQLSTSKPPPHFSMCLDDVLKQMEKGKDRSSKILCDLKNRNELVCPSVPSDSTITGFVATSLPGSGSKSGPLAYSASRGNSSVSDLILAPLNVGETLDEELNGESLFAANLADPNSKEGCQNKANLLKSKLYEGAADIAQSRTEQSVSNQAGGDAKGKVLEGLPVLTEQCNTGESKLQKNERKSLQSPPLTKRLLLTMIDEEVKVDDDMEDCISLFPNCDDDDLLGGEDCFTVKSPVKLSAKATKASQSAPSLVQPKKISFPHHVSPRVSPVPLDDGGFESSFEKPPARMPYKSQQVSHWVAEQQKIIKTVSPVVGGPAHLLTCDHRSSATPSPVMSFCHPQVQGRSTSSQESDGCPNSLGRLTRTVQTRPYCKYYLLQHHCPLRACRFTHCPREHAPPHVVEEMVFRQPLDMISFEELKPYVTNHHSFCVLKSNFALVVDMIKSLADKRFVSVIGNFVKFILSDGVKFSTSFLCRLMELCASQHPSSLSALSVSNLSMTSVGEQLLMAIEEARGHLVPQDYHLFFTILVNFKVVHRLSAAYQAMKKRQICPTASTLFVLLRFVKSLDNSVFPLLLNDVNSCQFNAVEKASYASRLMECVDLSLLEGHSAALGQWIAKATNDVTTKLSSSACEHLFATFVKKDQWGSVLQVLASCNRFLRELGPRVCEPLATVLQRMGPSTMLISVAEVLTEDQMGGMITQFWDIVLRECARLDRSQRISVIYPVLCRLKKQLSVETVSALTQMYLDQHNLPAATSLFLESLDGNPSIAQPGQLLTSICQAMEETKATHNLLALTKFFLDRGISPPAAVQRSVITLYVAEKQYAKLADVVKLSALKGVTLDKEFCQKSLVELRHWGRDADAISAIYKCLRKSSEDVGDGLQAVSSNPVSEVNHAPPQRMNSRCRSASIGESAPSSPPPPPPPLPRSMSEGDSGLKQPASIMPAEKLFCLNMTELKVQDLSDIYKLLEENGSKGQFGAVASILTDLPDSSEMYSGDAASAVWRGVVSSGQKPVSCFFSLLKNLDQHRAAKLLAQAESRKPGSFLLPGDRWLVSQVGLAILKSCDSQQDWESGFLVLHALHSQGVNYLSVRLLNASLPPFQPVPPSRCEVAMLAVKTCLKCAQVGGALAVLQGCGWIKASNDKDLKIRTEMLCSVAEWCLKEQMLQDVWKCLDNVDLEGKILAGFVYMVTNLYNRLLQEIVTRKDSGFALQIHHKMKHCKLQCLPTVFSSLLQLLTDQQQVEVAKSMCSSAISEGAYGSLFKENIFEIFLPSCLVKVEMHLLIEDHLRNLASKVSKSNFKSLTVNFCAGTRHLVEEVLARFIKPSLQATFTGTSFITVSSLSLQQWCSDNHCEEQGGASTSVGQKLLVSDLGNSFHQVSNQSDIKTGDMLGLGMGTGLCIGIRSRLGPRPGIPRDIKVMSEGDAHDVGLAEVKGEDRKDFKRAICNAVLDHIKPHYKEKFRTEADYLHLFRILSQNVARLYKSSISECSKIQTADGKSEFVLAESVLLKIKALVNDIMSRCQVYTRDQDDELGLTAGFSSD